MYKIYYSDKLVSSEDCAVEDTPARDVQVIVQEDPEVGWVTSHSYDHYVWTGTHWRGVDDFGLWDRLALPGWQKVIFGRTLLRSEFHDIYTRAKADKDFARKNGFLPEETQP